MKKNKVEFINYLYWWPLVNALLTLNNRLFLEFSSLWNFQGNFFAVPRDRTCFKIRANVEKLVYLTITQVCSEGQRKLEVKRCFGVLIAPGRHVKHSDMQLLDMVCIKSLTS